MTKSIFFVLLLVVSSYSEKSFLDSLPKCSTTDLECLKEVAESIMYNMTDNGIPEMGIPILDPMHIVSKTVTVTGLMDVTMVDGYVDGMRSCKIESFYTNFDTKITKFDIFCDVITIRGNYNLKSSTVVDKIFGIVSGNGNGSIVMEKLVMNFTSPYDVEMHDGEIYLIPDFDKSEYDYEVLEKVTFNAETIKMGNLEIAPAVTTFMSKNWFYVMKSFGRYFSDKAMSVSHECGKLFFKTVAARKFIADDLSKYVSAKGRCSLKKE